MPEEERDTEKKEIVLKMKRQRRVGRMKMEG